jgi:hypothetical protein
LKKVFNNSSNHKSAEIQVGNRLQYLRKIQIWKNIDLKSNNDTVHINYWTSYKKKDLIEKNTQNIFKEFELKKLIISNKTFKQNHLVKFINEKDEIGFGILIEILVLKLHDIEIIQFKVEILELLNYFNFKNTKIQKKIKLENVFGAPSYFNFEKNSSNYLYL